MYRVVSACTLDKEELFCLHRAQGASYAQGVNVMARVATLPFGVIATLTSASARLAVQSLVLPMLTPFAKRRELKRLKSRKMNRGVGSE